MASSIFVNNVRDQAIAPKEKIFFQKQKKFFSIKILPGTGGAFRGNGGSSLCASNAVRISNKSFSKS
jgi:hypothetical protein